MHCPVPSPTSDLHVVAMAEIYETTHKQLRTLITKPLQDRQTDRHRALKKCNLLKGSRDVIVTYYSIIMKPVKRCTLGISRGKGRKKDERLLKI